MNAPHRLMGQERSAYGALADRLLAAVRIQHDIEDAAPRAAARPDPPLTDDQCAATDEMAGLA